MAQVDAAFPAGISARKAPRRLLVVEDDFLIGQMIGDQLLELGHTVVGPASSVADARALAQDEILDGALLDWNLNGRSSGEVAEALTRRQIPFLFVTGYDKLPGGHYRDAAVLQKPFNLATLERALERLFNQGEAPAAP